MEDIEIVKKLASKTKLTTTEKNKIKQLAEKYNVSIRQCKCPSRFNDACYEIYLKLLGNNKKPIYPETQFEFVGVGEMYNSKYGKLSPSTPRNVILNIYENSYSLFKSFFKIK